MKAFSATLLSCHLLALGAGAAPPALDDRQLTLTAGDYTATFLSGAAYTLGVVSFRDQPLIATTGANQSVVNLQASTPGGPQEWAGSSHGGEEIRELTLEVDGKAYPLASPLTAPEGKNYTVVKISRMGPLEATTRTTVSAEGVRQQVRFTPVGDLSQARHLYVFMHCLRPTFHDWLARKASGEETGGRFPGERTNSLKEDVSGVAFYDESRQLGVTFLYPEAYPGEPGLSNLLINWPGRHHKHYLRLTPAQAAEGREYRCDLKGFTAPSATWQQQAFTP